MQNAIAATYLVLALGCGVVMAFLNPPFQAPDEPNHFFRALAISRGHWVATRNGEYIGSPMPANVIQWVFALSDDLPGHADRKQSVAFLRAHPDADPVGAMTFADFRNTALYSPVTYLPQAAGLAIGRWTGLPLLGSLYLARVLNLCAAAIVCYWACRQLPYGQLTVVLVLVSPMFVFETASLSADAGTYALTIAFAALVLRRIHEPPMARRAVVELCALGALMSLTKPSAAPVPLLAALLARRRPGATNIPWRSAVVIVAVSWTVLLGWSLLVRHLYVPAHPFVAVGPRAQLDRMITDPSGFASVLRSTIERNWIFYLRSSVGILGWLDTPLRSTYVDGFFVALLISGAVAEPARPHATWRERLGAVAVIAATSLLLAVVMYLTWTAVGGGVIEGIQGRYFLPLAALAAPLLQWPAGLQARIGPALRRVVATGCLAYAVLLLGHAFHSMAARFWS